jgi:hypothetical protein
MTRTRYEKVKSRLMGREGMRWTQCELRLVASINFAQEFWAAPECSESCVKRQKRCRQPRGVEKVADVEWALENRKVHKMGCIWGDLVEVCGVCSLLNKFCSCEKCRYSCETVEMGVRGFM